MADEFHAVCTEEGFREWWRQSGAPLWENDTRVSTEQLALAAWAAGAFHAREAERQHLASLASAMRKLLTPAELLIVISGLDPLGAFVQFLRSRE